MMLRTRGVAQAAALVIAAAVVAGCSSGPTTLSKPNFIRAADAICAATTTKIDAIPQLSASATPAQAVAPVQQALTIVEQTVTQLTALHAASGDAAVLDKNLIEPAKAQDAAAQTFITAMQAANGDTAAQQTAITRFSSATNDPNQDAEDSALAAYGFDACAKTSQ
jgi:hypothetical protein